MEARMALEPLLDNGVLVGGVVIHDQMQLQRFRRFPVDLLQEGQPLLMSVLCFDAADQPALQNVLNTRCCSSECVMCRRQPRPAHRLTGFYNDTWPCGDSRVRLSVR